MCARAALISPVSIAQHFFASARPLPYNVCKEACPALLALIIRSASYSITQELAADIVIEVGTWVMRQAMMSL